jgi:sulfite dehydrogenase
VGPNLDDAKPSYDHVVERVTEGKGRMPSFADQLSEAEIRNVAAYVSEATKG